MENNYNEEEERKNVAPAPATTAITTLSDQIASAALSAYASLPKTGKPQSFEHTAFAAIALTFPPDGHAATCLGLPKLDDKTTTSPLIIAMATGTKCLSGSKRASDGSALNDCHAEVLARRAFLRWIYDEIQYIAASASGAASGGASSEINKNMGDTIKNTEGGTGGKESVISPISLVLCINSESNKVELVQGVEIHLFTSHPPCGDAAIGVDAAAAAAAEGEGAIAVCGPEKPPICGCPSSLPTNTTAMANGVGRTGAKPIVKRHKPNNTDKNDEKIAQQQNLPTIPTETAPLPIFPTTTTIVNTSHITGAEWVLPQARDVESYASIQLTGVVRRKPGRGDPTLSVSCSDKIAKWSLLGIQGSLLSSLLATPLFLTSLVVGAPQKQSIDILKKEESISGSSGVETTENALKRAFQDRIASLRTHLTTTKSTASVVLPVPPVLETYAVPLAASELNTLGLLANEVRKVPCGTSITWRASPSATWRLKQVKETHQWTGNLKIDSKGGSGGGATGGESLFLKSPIVPTLLINEGFSEAITGLFGCKAGAPRRGADLVPPERQSALCRAALFSRFHQVSTALHQNRTSGDGGMKIKMTYAEAKDKAGTVSGYKSRWKEVTTVAQAVETETDPSSLSFLMPFEGWIQKPSLGSEFYDR